MKPAGSVPRSLLRNGGAGQARTETLGPGLLLTVAAGRLRAARPDVAARFDLTSPLGLLEARAALATDDADPAGGPLAVTVVGRFNLPQWVVETCAFALSVPAERREAWRRTFTRTVFLVGRPVNLAGRFSFDHVAEDGSMAWAGPVPGEQTAALRRLLKTFSGTREVTAWAPVDVEVRAPSRGAEARRPVHRDLYIATTHITVSELLVQVNHLLVESVLDGLIAHGDRLTLRSVDRLAGPAVPFAALRVDTDTRRPEELRAYAALTEEI